MLKINLDEKAKTLNGKDLFIGNEVPTVGELLFTVMQARPEKEAYEQTLSNMKIAKKLAGDGEIELSAEEIVTIKKLAHLHSNPIFFSVVAIIEP